MYAVGDAYKVHTSIKREKREDSSFCFFFILSVSISSTARFSDNHLLLFASSGIHGPHRSHCPLSWIEPPAPTVCMHSVPHGSGSEGDGHDGPSFGRRSDSNHVRRGVAVLRDAQPAVRGGCGRLAGQDGGGQTVSDDIVATGRSDAEHSVGEPQDAEKLLSVDSHSCHLHARPVHAVAHVG